MLLTVPVAAPDALLDALRVPREVVVDDQRAELKIDPLCGSLGGDHNYRLVVEILDQRSPHVGGLGA